MAESRLPEYNASLAKLLDWPTTDVNMYFPKVGMRFYPLRADLRRLQALLDSYLNFADDSQNQPPYMFKAAAPFVLLQTVNYDRLEIDAGEGAPKQKPLAWLKQHEAIFSIPIEWHEWTGSQWRFVDWAMTYPFIYLDHPISIWIGREMYGWPKMPVRVPNLFPLSNPPDPNGRVAFWLGGRSARNPDRPEPFRPFIEVDQAASAFDPLASLGDWLTRWPKMASDALSTMAALTDIARGAGMAQWLSGSGRSEPFPATARESLKYASQWAPQLLNMFGSAKTGEAHQFTPSPFMKNNIVLKQFRDAHDYKSACYQALVRSELAVQAVHGGGFLFNPMLADPTGGVTIKLHHFDQEAVIEALGLAQEARLIADPSNGRRKIYEFKPFFPFWWNLDLTYGKAEQLCWRAKTTKWSTTDDPGDRRAIAPDYVTSGGGAIAEIGGAVKFPNFEMLVMPLPANLNTLNKLCKIYLNHEDYRFRTNVNYVFAIANQFRAATAGTDPLERLADSEFIFAVAGEYYDASNPSVGWRPVVMPMIGFTGAEWDSISDREVLGRFSLASKFIPANSPLLADFAPHEPHVSFYLQTTLCPALNEDEQARLWTLLGVGRGKAASGARTDADAWLNKLGLGSISDKGGFDSVGLKQFRDARFANRACYQALVKVRRVFDRTPRVTFVPGSIRIDIHKFDTMDLVATFGITRGSQTKEGRFQRPCYSVEAVNPFIVTGGMRQLLPENLCWRAGAMGWQRDMSQSAVSDRSIPRQRIGQSRGKRPRRGA